MLTKNNWLSSNISNRLTDPFLDFDVKFNLYPFSEMSFLEASEYTSNEIYKEHKNLYLALSGGMDSEYILRAFHKAHIPICPIIVCCGNEKENVYAYKVCNELNLIPVVINVSEETLLRYFVDHIYLKLKGIGYNTTQVLFAAEYARENKGVLITGNHFIGDGDEMISEEIYASSNEWDFYTDVFNCTNIDFFLYTPEIAYSMMPDEYTKWNLYKQKLYGIEYRNKMKAIYSEKARNIIHRIIVSTGTKRASVIWTKSQFFDIFKEYKINHRRYL